MTNIFFMKYLFLTTYFFITRLSIHVVVFFFFFLQEKQKGGENEVGEIDQPLFLKVSPHSMAVGY